MKYELGLYRRTRAPQPDLQEPTPTQLRKEMREASDGLMLYALQRQSIAAVATHSAMLLLQSARTLNACQEEPQVADLVGGACSLIQDVRDKIDRALLLGDGEQLRWGTTMLEVVVRGVLAVLVGTVPYETLMETIACHEDLHSLLMACGALPPSPETPT